MPAAAKSPLSSKNPAAVARKMYAGPGIVGGNGNGGHAEVVCPLFNADGSACRKKCVGNFAYRSICEHIRRAHPDNWIPKLPASHETFAKMVSQSPRATAPAAGAQFHLRKPPLHTPHMHQQHAQLAVSAVFRKMGKSALKREDDQYMEGLSPPSSANESEPPSLPPISLSTGVSFQSKLPSPPGMSDYDVRDDDEFAHVEDDDVRSSVVSRSTSGGGGAGFHLGLTTKLAQDTEDDSDDAAHRRSSHRPPPPNHHHHHQQLLLHHHHHHRQLPSPHTIRPSKSSAGVKRKRVAYAASNPETSSPTSPPSAGGGGGGSTDNSSSQSSAASRWDELIEAATNRAVAIDPQSTFRHHSHHHHHHHTPQTPLSPPTTASSSSYTPTLAPPSASATPPSSTTPSEFAALSTPRKLVCATCEGATPMHMAFACTECMSGFCDECAFGAGRRGSCGECRAVGGKFKPLRIIVR